MTAKENKSKENKERVLKTQIIPEVQEYIDIVRSGKWPECDDQVAFCDLIERAFEKESLYFDTEQLEKYLNLQKYFPFRLFPWETCLFALHNCCYSAPGQLRWPDLLILVGRGAGKNGFESFEGFCWLTPINGIKDYHVDIFAMAEIQAKTSFEDVYAVLEAHRDQLEKYFTWNLEVITNKATGSQLRFRTAGVKSKDGGRPGALVFDEKHAYENNKLIKTCKTGLGKKRMPRQTTISTDGDVRDGPLDADKEKAKKILYEGAPDNGLLPFICKLNHEDLVNDKNNWHMANPSLRYEPMATVLMAEMLKEYEDYLIDPVSNQDFMTKRMNLPRSFEQQDVTAWENVKAANAELPDLTGRDCVGAVDYAKTIDMISAGCLFLYKGEYLWITKSWMCRNSPDIKRIKAPIEEWAAQGLLEFIDGPEVPPSVPAEWLAEQATKYNMTCIGVDSFRFTLLRKALKDAGFDTDKDGANNVRLTKRVTIMRYAPVIISAFARQAIKWGKNALMNWAVGNTYIEMDKDGNILFKKKEAKSRKTDPYFAFVHAVCASEELEDCGETVKISEKDFRIYTY